jgi:hypothetical protein
MITSDLVIAIFMDFMDRLQQPSSIWNHSPLCTCFETKLFQYLVKNMQCHFTACPVVYFIALHVIRDILIVRAPDLIIGTAIATRVGSKFSETSIARIIAHVRTMDRKYVIWTASIFPEDALSVVLDMEAREIE